jgi:hypothetical protein
MHFRDACGNFNVSEIGCCRPFDNLPQNQSNAYEAGLIRSYEKKFNQYTGIVKKAGFFLENGSNVTTLGRK